MNAHFSYMKEDQENLRQSVKAIAVSMSNVLDRTDDERDELKKFTNSVIDLQTRTKQHFYRLNDHIQKVLNRLLICVFYFSISKRLANLPG